MITGPALRCCWGSAGGQNTRVSPRSSAAEPDAGCYVASAMTPPRMPALLVADPGGTVLEHPRLLATVRSADELMLPPEPPVPLPEGGRLVHLPGRRPVGVDPDTGELVLVSEVHVGRRRFVPHAVGALVPPGWTRTFLPGEVKADGPVLPQWAYTAAGWAAGGPVAWALHTDRRTHWEPGALLDPRADVSGARARAAADPGNRVLRQLETCALVYRCFTSQNVFYGRDEGALPVSTMCNAACVGCISDQPDDGPPASHARMDDGPTAEELARVAVAHLRSRRAAGDGELRPGLRGRAADPLAHHRRRHPAHPRRDRARARSTSTPTPASPPGCARCTTPAWTPSASRSTRRWPTSTRPTTGPRGTAGRTWRRRSRSPASAGHTWRSTS